MEQTTFIGDLGVPTATRPRGEEAYRRLRQRWTEERLAVLLDGVPLLSLSFLDELIAGLLRAGELDRVTFVTAQARTREKLARVAALHPEAAIFVRMPGTPEAERVAPQPFESNGPIPVRPKDHDPPDAP
jgi:hypothetical protein